jgi:tRNA (guanine10-N2)-methyltransferase
MHIHVIIKAKNFQPLTFMTPSKDFLLRFVQQHPTFRLAELDSCAALENSELPLPLTFVEYDDSIPFAVVRLDSEKSAAQLIQRSILTQYNHEQHFLTHCRSIFELWGCGSSYDELHRDVVTRSQSLWVHPLFS